MSSRTNATDPRAGFPESSFQYVPLQHLRYLFLRFTQGLFAALPVGCYHWEADAMHINCCSRVDLEADNIAWFVSEQLWLHRAMLMAAGFFEIGRQPVIGAPSKAGSLIQNDSGDEWYCTTVACPFQFARTSQTTPLNRKIASSIEFSLLHRNQYVSGSDALPDTPGLPAQIDASAPAPFVPASDAYGGTPDPGGTASPAPQYIPYPLNPARMVRVVVARTGGPALRPPSIGGRPIPLLQPRVEDSGLQAALPSKFRT